jgi:hypothetical protein
LTEETRVPLSPAAARLLLALLIAFSQAAVAGGIAAGTGAEAIPVSGQPFRARLTAVLPGWKLQFEVDGAKRELPAADLVRWGDFAESSRGPQVLLTGGGLIVADVREIDREKLSLDSELLGRVPLPLESVPAILFHPPSDRHRRDQLIRRVLSLRGEGDRLLLDNGDELPGTIAALHDDVLSLETAAGKLEIELPRIAAVVFNPGLLRPELAAGLRMSVGLRDGSRLAAVRLEADADKARITLAGGKSVETDTDSIVALQPLGGRAVYLSDLKADSYKHIPFLQIPWPYEADRNVRGDLLRASGKLFQKGLGMHSASRLTYHLDREYDRLEAQLAIDDATAGFGSVVFRIFVDDDDGHWQPRYTSPVIRGGDPPLPISIELGGSKRISLLVEFADRGDEMDDADWLDARLVR